MLSALLLAPSLPFQPISITPEVPLPLGGYTARNRAVFEPGGQDLWAVGVRFGETTVVTCELLTVPESLQREVAKRLPGQKVLLIATHTHCAPDSQMLNDRMTMLIPGVANFNRRWLNWFADRIAQAARQAVPVASLSGWRDATPAWVKTRRSETSPDSRFFVGEFQKVPLGVYAAHPTFWGSSMRRLDGDWPGVFLRQGFVAWPGAIGNASPAPLPLPSVDAQLGSLRFPALPQGTLLPEPLRWSSANVSLDPVEPHPEFAAANKITPELAANIVRRFAPASATVHVMTAGAVAFIFVPGEPTSNIGWEIENRGRKLGFKRVVTVSHAGGWCGYILDSEDYLNGGYEATLAFHGPFAGRKFIDAAEQALKKLRQ